MITHENKSPEQVVEEILAALVKQGGRCMIDEECSYGNKKEEHCAVGFLLPENREDLMDFEGGIAFLLSIDDLGPNDVFIRDNEDLLESLQCIHDFSTLEGLEFAAQKFPYQSKALDLWVALRMEQMR